MGKEKKEIGKLLELLNEYCVGAFVYDNDILRFRLGGRAKIEGNAILISKSFGFIKWLVENDKIDRDNARLRKSLWETDTSDIDRIIYIIKNSDYHYAMREAPYEAEETLLMLLSISDTPIEDLISYLR